MLVLQQLQPEQDIPIYQQLVDMILAQVKNGTLSVNTQLPTVRALAERLHVARGTVKRAYDELELSGVISKVQGRGTFVCYQPATADSRKERAMAAIDQMLDTMRELDFSTRDIRIFLDLKLRDRALHQDNLKIALVECNPEVLSQLADQLHKTVGPVDLSTYLLQDVVQYPYRIAEDMDLIITSAQHADMLQNVISQREKIAKIALHLTSHSVAGILKLPSDRQTGILCRSQRFGELIYGVCSAYAQDAQIRQPMILDTASHVTDYLSGLAALVVSDDFESHCPPSVLADLRAFEKHHVLIRCRYQMDEGSMLYLTERIDRLRDKKRI